MFSILLAFSYAEDALRYKTRTNPVENALKYKKLHHRKITYPPVMKLRASVILTKMGDRTVK